MYQKKVSYYTTLPQNRMLKINKTSFDYHDTKYSHKNSSDGFKYFDAYPQNQYVDSIELQEQESQCPSIENQMLEGMLDDLRNEIRLKSAALTKAEKYIEVLHEELSNSNQREKQYKAKLDELLKKSKELQLETSFPKSSRFDESGKKSITRTYKTQRNIIYDESQMLKLISSQVFNEFASNFENLVKDLNHFIEKQRDSDQQNCLFTKLQNHKSEVQDLLYGKYDGEYSKTTSQTFASSKRKYSQISHQADISSYNYYEQVIDLYKQQLEKMSGLLCLSVNYIQQLSKSLQKSLDRNSQLSDPSSLLPQQLIQIVVRECCMMMNHKFERLKIQNFELMGITNEMIDWIHRNSNGDHPSFGM